MNIVYNADCLEAMRKMPDNAFDLAVVDPPYGAGFTEGGGCKGWFTKYHQETEKPYNRFGNPGSRFEKYKRSEDIGGGGTDSERASTVTRTGGTWAEKYAKKLYRGMLPRERNTSMNFFASHGTRLYGGGNYFSLPPTRCFLIWRKLSISESFTMAMCEYAWTSFNGNAKMFEYAPQGKANDPRFHPTQKPIELYAWIFNLFAKPGMKIIDTHLGSGSSRIAAWEAGLDFVGYEIDKDYYEKQEERFKKHTAQGNLFAEPQDNTQTEQLTLEWR